MSQGHCNNESRKGKHINEIERYKIETLAKEKMPASQIAVRLERNRRTIERELRLGMVKLLHHDLTSKTEYCADAAQRRHDENAQNKGPSLKIGYDHKLVRYIEKKIIKGKYSPDAVIGEIKEKKLKFESMICTKTLYNYIDRGLFAKISNKDLLEKRHKKKRTHKTVRVAHNNSKGTSIDERPKAIEKRLEQGHWEIDLVLGKKESNTAALLTLTERKTRQQVIRKIPNKSQNSVLEAIDTLERMFGNRFYERFKTITADNGSEFLDFESLERSSLNPGIKRFKIYYAHPYCSWERGTNENSNRIIRRFIPKGTDIGKISKAEIKRIECWMNNYPRKILGYKTASEMAA